MSNITRKINKASVLAIMNRRSLVPESMIGKKVVLTIQGDGAIFDVVDKEGNNVESVVEPGTQFQKVIFNLQANSGIALKNPRNKEYSALGLAAEKAGNVDEAHKQFSLFLNATQMSFSVPTTQISVLSKLRDRVDISARIVKIETENGSLLTIDPTTISVLEPATLGATNFAFDMETADEVLNPEGAALSV